MSKIVKRLSIIANFTLVVICVIHICNIGYSNLHPDVPDIVVYKRNLKEIDFPLSFRLCIFSKDSAKFQIVGYKNEFNFFKGQSFFNHSLIGWNGHRQNGSTVGSYEGFFQN